MVISGYLSDFSLPEILQFLDEGSKSGLLAVQPSGLGARAGVVSSTALSRHYFIWFNEGRIIAAADQQDYRGLVRMIAQRKWMDESKLQQLISQCPSGSAFGSFLKSQNLLSADQLRLLFSTQVIRQICALFELVNGSYEFVGTVHPPFLEMTGLSAPAKEVILPGLRALNNWSTLAEKLPSSSSSLVQNLQSQPELRLNAQETQVQGLTDGTTPLQQIAKQMALPLETVQKIAFRLIVTGFAEEVPLATEAAEARADTPAELESAGTTGIRQGFLERLMGYLNQI
jgi:Domain of unknown function (DUF4388)